MKYAGRNGRLDDLPIEHLSGGCDIPLHPTVRTGLIKFYRFYYEGLVGELLANKGRLLKKKFCLKK